MRLTDSLIVNEAFVNSSNISIASDTSNVAVVRLHDMFEGQTIDYSLLTLRYETDTTEYDRQYLSISVYWDDDEFGIYGSPFVDVHLCYYEVEPYYCTQPVYRRYFWGIMYFVKDNRVSHYRILEMAE